MIFIDLTGDFDQSINNFNRKGKKTLARWDLDINSGKSLRYATIHRAAYRYHMGDTGGLRRPYFIRGNTKIGYFDRAGRSDFNRYLTDGWWADIRIYRRQKGWPDTKTDGIFATTSHELGHAAHYCLMGNVQYHQVQNYIYESWATFVKWHMTMLEYRGLGLAQNRLDNINNTTAYQWWTGNNDDKEYSPLFIDLVDDLDQRANNGGNAAFPADSVTGYTASMINEILKKSYGLCSLKSTLKSNKPAGVTDRQIDRLFQVYEQTFD